MHFLCFLAFFEQKKEAYGLHFATVASGELVTNIVQTKAASEDTTAS